MSIYWPHPHTPRTSKNGAYAAVRQTPADGGCGVSGHPCTHWGADLLAVPGTPVRAPEDGFVVYSVEGETDSDFATPRPFRGFGPAVVVVRGTETGLYHLLAHCRRGSLRFGSHRGEDGLAARVELPVRGGELVGVVSGLNHTHWQVQTQATLGGASSWGEVTQDPIAWGRTFGATTGSLPTDLGDAAVAAAAVAAAAAAAAILATAKKV